MNTTLPIPSIRLLKQLSRNIYSSFKVGLKEFIINSFDASATKVDIRIDYTNKSISIKDNGIGMAADEIYNYFLRAGSTTKEVISNINDRPVLGYKGIGVFSIFFFAKSLDVVSWKDGIGTTCTIDLSKLQDATYDSQIDSEEILSWKSLTNEGKGTEIIIHGIDESSFSSIWNASRQVFEQEIYLYFSEVLPVAFNESDEGVMKSTYIKEEYDQLKKWNFSVFINDSELLRTTPYQYFSERSLLSTLHIKEFEKDLLDGKIKMRIVIFGGIKKIQNERYVGLLVRNNNVAIGTRKDNLFDMRSRIHMLQWISGEVLLYGNINEYITTDRERIIEDSELFSELRNCLFNEITPFLTSLQSALEKDKKQRDNTKELNDINSFTSKIGKQVKRNPKEIEIINDKKKPIVSTDPTTNNIIINRSNKAEKQFTKWSDKELFYSFLTILQSKLSSSGDPGCKELFIEIQNDFEKYIDTKSNIEGSEEELGF